MGALLSSLAAAVPRSGRILELGTGVGAGLAWIVEGLGPRRDVEVVSVDIDAALQDVTRAAGWPDCVAFELGDGAELLPDLGYFDLIFADAPGGKLEGLDRSIAALHPRGVLLVDDMDVSRQELPEMREALLGVRDALQASPALHTVELDYASGIMLCVKR